MNYYAMDTEQVQSSGRSIHAQGPDAGAAVQGILGSYLDAADVVHHPVVAGAMRTFHADHQKSHLQLQPAVEACGANVAGGGVDIADANNEATTVQKGNVATQQTLNRDVNTPL